MLLFLMELLILLLFGTFLFEEKAICGVTSGQRWMEWFPLLTEVSHNEAKIKDLPLPFGRHANISQPLRKPSMVFLCRDVISFKRLSRSEETDDFMVRSKWEISKLAEGIIYRGLYNNIVSVQSNKARALPIKWNRFWKPVSFDRKFGRRLHQTTRRKPAEVSLLSFHFASSRETSAGRELCSITKPRCSWSWSDRPWVYYLMSRANSVGPVVLWAIWLVAKAQLTHWANRNCSCTIKSLIVILDKPLYLKLWIQQSPEFEQLHVQRYVHLVADRIAWNKIDYRVTILYTRKALGAVQSKTHTLFQQKHWLYFFFTILKRPL